VITERIGPLLPKDGKRAMTETTPGGHDHLNGPRDARPNEGFAVPTGGGAAVPPSPAQAEHQDDDLRESLAALSRLSMSQLDLKDAMTRIAEYAVAAIPGADGAGVTLLERGHADTIVASAPFVAEVDTIQYSIKQGPCITAAREGRTVRAGELNVDPQWPRFGPEVGRLGVHSVLSLPLMTPAGVVGAMNVYAHSQNAFSDHAALIGELFAEPAAIAVQNAQVLAQSKRLATQLQSALSSRAVIDQALGILMSRVGSTADEAFDRLRERSQADNVKLRDVAQRVVDEAVRRARARHVKP
jgi:GAF domain-containing protein